MTAAAFDTHRYVELLTGKGFSETWSEAIVDIIKEAREEDMEKVATKAA